MGTIAPTVSKLTDAWNMERHSNRGWPKFLTAIYIDGLRGWKDQWIGFRYPVVAIAGENGSGKSTILKVAATAYGADADGTDYSPDDFFPTTPWEVVSRVRLQYQVQQGETNSTHAVKKPSDRWRGMPDRPKRSKYYLDISRTQPIDTLIGYGKVARRELAEGVEKKLSPEYLNRLSRVLGRSYEASSVVGDSKGKQVGIVSLGGLTYSNFHQGAGEDASGDLMVLLEQVPPYSLVLIDEVESSLHPRAQRRLMTELIEIAKERKLQLITTTHSSYVLEQLPPEARIYIRIDSNGEREPVYGISAKFALGLMDDERHPEMFAYCEDKEAQSIIELVLRLEEPELLEQIAVVEVGPASTVKAMGELAHSGKFHERGLAVLDGDQAASAGCICLPGMKLPPEKAVIEEMPEKFIKIVAERLGVREGDLLEARADALRLQGPGKHHLWAQKIAERLSGTMQKSKVWDAFIDVWVRDVLTPAEREDFKEQFVEALRATQ